MRLKLVEFCWWRLLHRFGHDADVCHGLRVRGSFECLADDSVRGDVRTEEPAGNPSHDAPLLCSGAAAGHGRGSSHALQG